MLNKFIIDQEINLNNSDFLKTKVYADNLSKIIKNTVENKVFTIGLFGNWGTGKSSIVRTSQEQIENENKRIKFVTYDAWQYVNDSFRRMFLRKLREDLKYEETDLMKRFYENESMDIGNKYQISATKLSWILGGLILLLLILTFIPIEIDYKLPIYSFFTLLGLLITIISGAFHQLKISVSKPHFFAPEQFEECFKEIVTNSLSKRNNILKWVKGDKSIQNLERLVIVIDNIDRCSSDVAYNLLTDIKTFFSSEPYSIVFIIPVDDNALKKHIIKSNHDISLCHQESEEFLRKFFNVTLRIKPYNETDLFYFAEQIAMKSNLKLKPETINIASKEYAKSPRRIIQLFNNLLVEKNFDIDFSEKNETLICCILIIREEYPEYFDAILNSPKVFNEREYNTKDEKLKRFIRIAQTAIGNVRINDLNRILTNTHNQFINIPIDIKDAIDTFDFEKVLNVWENEKQSISSYILDRLSNSVKNNLIETDLVAYFDLLTNINAVFPFNDVLSKRIDEKVQPYLSILITKTLNHDNLCRYALLREQQKASSIKNTLIEESKRLKDQQKGEYWEKLFKAILNNFKDKKTALELSPTFDFYHNYFDEIELSEEQIEHLFSDTYVQERIADLPTDNNEEIVLNVESNEYKKLKWIFENKKNISEDAYSHFFAKVIGKRNDDSRMRDKTNEDILNLLLFVNPILSLIPNNKLKKQPETLYSLITGYRKISHPSYRNDSRYDSQISFIDESLANNKYLQEIIDFVINIYRISNNETNTKDEINKILKVKNIDNIFVSLIETDLDLHPILDIVFEAAREFDKPESLFVLGHCFIQQKGDSYLILDEKANKKLDELLIYAQAEDSKEVYSLLELLIKKERYSDLLKKIIIDKDSDFINSLPNNLFRLAIGSFNKNNYKDYSNNFDFMSSIIQHGSKNQKHFVVQILIEKLDNNEDIDNSLRLIESMTNIPSFDESGLILSHLDSFKRQNKETLDNETLSRVNKLIKKLKQ